MDAQLLSVLKEEISGFEEHEFRSQPEVMKKSPVALAARSEYEPSSAAKSAKKSFLHFHRQRLLDEIKEQVLQVSETTFNAADLALRPPRYFELPTGYNRNFTLERFRVAECIFSPEKFAAANTQHTFIGLTEMVAKCLSQCDADMRGSLVNSIVVTGGASLLSGLQERILTEFSKLSAYVSIYHAKHCLFFIFRDALKFILLRRRNANSVPGLVEVFWVVCLLSKVCG